MAILKYVTMQIPVFNQRTTVLICLFVSVILLFIIVLSWAFLSYHTLKLLKKKIVSKLYFDSYKSSCKTTLEKYGDLPIKRIYLVRGRVSQLLVFLTEFVTWKDFGHQVNRYREMTNESTFFPYHTYMMVEVELENKLRKTLIIEKSNGVEVTPNFRKCESQDMMKVTRKKNVNITINKILKQTKERIGSEQFFNWHLYKNNCQQFTLEILKSLGKKNPMYEEFVLQKKFFNTIKISEPVIYIMNYFNNLLSFIESVVNDINLF